MVTKYRVTGGWSTVSGGAVNTTAPGLSDIAEYDVNSPALETLAAAMAIQGLVFSAFTGTFDTNGYDVAAYTSGIDASTSAAMSLVDAGSTITSYGDVTLPVGGSLTVSDLQLEGTANQTIDAGGSNFVALVSNKTLGSVTVLEGNVTLSGSCAFPGGFAWDAAATGLFDDGGSTLTHTVTGDLLVLNAVGTCRIGATWSVGGATDVAFYAVDFSHYSYSSKLYVVGNGTTPGTGTRIRGKRLAPFNHWGSVYTSGVYQATNLSAWGLSFEYYSIFAINGGMASIEGTCYFTATGSPYAVNPYNGTAYVNASLHNSAAALSQFGTDTTFSVGPNLLSASNGHTLTLAPSGSSTNVCNLVAGDYRELTLLDLVAGSGSPTIRFGTGSFHLPHTDGLSNSTGTLTIDAATNSPYVFCYGNVDFDGVAGAGTVDVNGTLTLAGTASRTLEAKTVDVSGLSIRDQRSAGLLTVNGSEDLYFNGGLGANVTLSASYMGTVYQDGAARLGTITITSGTWDTNGYLLRCTGTVEINAGATAIISPDAIIGGKIVPAATYPGLDSLPYAGHLPYVVETTGASMQMAM